MASMRVALRCYLKAAPPTFLRPIPTFGMEGHLRRHDEWAGIALCSSVALQQQGNKDAINYANNIDEYNGVISQLNFFKRSHLLRDVYEDMLLDGVQPLPATFTALVIGCMKGSRLQDALFFFEQMKSMGIFPDVLVFNCLIATCGKCKAILRAFQIAEEMVASGIPIKMKTLTTLLSACGAAGAPVEAEGVRRKMVSSTLTLNKYCYAAQINAYMNQVPLSKDAFDKMFDILSQSRSVSANESYTVQTGAQSTNEIDDELYNLATVGFLQMRGSSLNRQLIVYHAALRGCADHGNTQALKNVLEMMRQDALQPDTFCIAQIIRCHLACGELSTALRAFHGYLNSGKQLQIDLFLIFIYGAMKGYKPEGMEAAREVLQEMKGRGLFLNARLGSELLFMASNEPDGGYKTANLIFDTMLTQNVTPTFRSLTTYLDGLKRRKIPEGDPRLGKVLRLMKEIQTGSRRRVRSASQSEQTE